MANTESLQYIRGQLDEYEKKEQWLIDHQDAMLCYKLEEFIALRVLLFKRISRIDLTWHANVLENVIPFSEEFEQAIRDLYRYWAKSCMTYTQVIKQAEEKGYEVEGATEYLACCNEVRGVLTPDEEFFVNEVLAQARDKAIDEHRAGQTSEIGSLSD